jgi:hypothetical protein
MSADHLSLSAVCFRHSSQMVAWGQRQLWVLSLGNGVAVGDLVGVTFGVGEGDIVGILVGVGALVIVGVGVGVRV